MKVLTKIEIQGCVCIYNLSDLKHSRLVAKTLRQFSESPFKHLHKPDILLPGCVFFLFFWMEVGVVSALADVPVAIIKEIYAS